MSQSTSQFMNSKDYQESLRSLKPTVYVDGRLIESVADEPSLRPGVQALGVTYDMVHDPALAPLMLLTLMAPLYQECFTLTTLREIS